MPAEMPARVVWVHWLDAATGADFTSHKEAIKELGRGLKLDAVGWVLMDDEDGVLPSQDMHTPEEQSRHLLFIPRGMILSMRDLK